jgi:hypothetical protein
MIAGDKHVPGGFGQEPLMPRRSNEAHALIRTIH